MFVYLVMIVGGVDGLSCEGISERCFMDIVGDYR